MELNKLEQYLLSRAGSELSYPFGPEVRVYKVKGKMFAWVAHENTPLDLTVKCQPSEVDFLVDEYASIKRGYHMNKRHWVTIALDGEVSESMLEDLIDRSYRLVVSKLPKREQTSLLIIGDDPTP
ncbi:MmcQ/YjbR family DNA-binding protein [Vibrio sp. WXL210]|uniref:MmcQ/YjbR family DNA-binding protein n=1 Tax=Vibrio sp. WXL210 TaxID=3450709 RepID=UPI003EC5AF41